MPNSIRFAAALLAVLIPAFCNASISTADVGKDCTSSATAFRLVSESIAGENNKDLIAATLLQIGLRARSLHHGTEGEIISSAMGVQYVEHHDRGRIVFSANQSGAVTSVTVQCCSGVGIVSQETAEKVAEAMARQVFELAFKQPQADIDKLLSFYENSDKPRTVTAFCVALMKSEHVAVPGAKMAEVREAFGEPESNVGDIGRELWTYSKPFPIRVQFDNGIVAQPPAVGK